MPALSARAFDRQRDLRRVLELVARARASDPHAFLHPGGLQWLLRRLVQPGFHVRQWFDGEALAGVVVDDSGYVIVQAAAGDTTAYLWLLGEAESDLRRHGRPTIEVSAWDDDRDLLAALRSLGYEPSGTNGRELVTEDLVALPDPVLPAGFTMRWLEPELDDAYVELHRAAWSTRAPSTYSAQLHAAVTSMPDFAPELVPIVAAPGGTLAAYCIAWFDPRTRTVEIEPLGTRPEFRRRGLARQVVQEVLRRSAARGAKSVMVWSSHANAAAAALYESAGLHSRRVLREYRRNL
jgi:ribosomal protein S18 acetylase RimI-like enzyme